MLTPFKQNFAVKRGQSFRARLEYFEPDGVTPVNMTGWQAVMEGRPEPGSDILHFRLTTENGGIILHPTNGSILLHIADEETDTFDWVKCKHDLKLIYPNGDDDYFFEGSFTVGTRITL